MRLTSRPRSEAGNVVIFILIGIGLFAALAYTFMRGGAPGQKQLTSNQARMAAQELLSFFNMAEKAAGRLLSRGCSESDISFANPKDDGPFISLNDSPTAPTDKSCHIFDPAGGGLNMNMDWTLYQVPYERITAGHASYNNIRFKEGIIISGIGTVKNELVFSINHIRPEVCSAYNNILGIDADLSVLENNTTADPVIGNENTAFARKTTFCANMNSSYYNNGPHRRILYAWLAR